MSNESLIIIGGGPAGLTAAIYAGRADLSPLLFIGPTPGGQVSETTIVENYPGFPEGIMGPELVNKFREQAVKFGTKIINQTVTRVDLRQKPLLVEAGNEKYYGKSLIIATGATARWLNLPSETKFRGKGVSACATCDGPLFRQQDVAVIGGGDAAMEEALFLTKYANKVTIIHRRDEFRASKIMLTRAQKHPKIKFLTNKKVLEFTGDNRLRSITLEDTVNQERMELPVTGAFLAIGHIPNTEIFKEFISVDDKNYLNLTRSPLTEVEGVFVAGDVADGRYRQIITAAGSGCKAAIEAEKYLGAIIGEEL